MIDSADTYFHLMNLMIVTYKNSHTHIHVTRRSDDATAAQEGRVVQEQKSNVPLKQLSIIDKIFYSLEHHWPG